MKKEEEFIWDEYLDTQCDLDEAILHIVLDQRKQINRLERMVYELHKTVYGKAEG